MIHIEPFSLMLLQQVVVLAVVMDVGSVVRMYGVSWLPIKAYSTWADQSGITLQWWLRRI